MPLVIRSINHGPEGGQPQERVKLEEPYSEVEESWLSGESKELVQGKWNDEENLKFVVFIHYYQEIFSSKHKRKVYKIFKTFEEYLQDRKAAQCRSHYQKMIQKFKTVAKIRKYHENYYGRELYRQQFENFKAMWEITHPPIVSKDPHIKESKEVSIQTDDIPNGQAQGVCCRCAGSLQQLRFPGEVGMRQLGEFNPYLYWNQMNQMGLSFYCMFPPRSEETIDIQ